MDELWSHCTAEKRNNNKKFESSGGESIIWSHSIEYENQF